MRKVIIYLGVLISIVITTLLILKGNKNVPSYQKLGLQDQKLQSKIVELNNIQRNNYQTSENQLNQVMKEYEEKKKEYNEKIEIAKRSGANGELQIEKYRQEFIWATLGTYAKEKGVDLKIEMTPSTGIEISDGFKGEFALHDFKIEAVGDYKQIEGFLYSLEGDEKFKARLNDFSLGANVEKAAAPKQEGTDIKKASEKISTKDLKANFVIKNVPLDITGLATSLATKDVKNVEKEGTKKLQKTNNSVSKEDSIINDANAIGNSGSTKDIQRETKKTIN